MNHLGSPKEILVNNEFNRDKMLANLGQTSAWGTTVLNRPPDGMIELLARDAHGAALSRRS
nr:hypothetical protein Iba_chr10dCG14370 [Ipomoea batatas]